MSECQIQKKKLYSLPSKKHALLNLRGQQSQPTGILHSANCVNTALDSWKHPLSIPMSRAWPKPLWRSTHQISRSILSFCKMCSNSHCRIPANSLHLHPDCSFETDRIRAMASIPGQQMLRLISVGSEMGEVRRYGSSMETGTTRLNLTSAKIARAKRPFSALSGRPGGWSQLQAFPTRLSPRVGCWCTQAINLSAASMGCSILALPRVFAVCGMSLGSCRIWGGFGQGWQRFQSSLTLAVTFSWISRTTVLVELPPVYIRVFWMFCMTKCCKHLWVYLVYVLHNSAVLNHLKFNNSIVTVWHLELHHAKPLSFLEMVGGCGALTVSMDYGGFTRFLYVFYTVCMYKTQHVWRFQLKIEIWGDGAWPFWWSFPCARSAVWRR